MLHYFWPVLYIEREFNSVHVGIKNIVSTFVIQKMLYLL